MKIEMYIIVNKIETITLCIILLFDYKNPDIPAE